MISQTAEYGFRAVVWLASQPDGAVTNRQIAEGTKVPAGYLSKVMQLLVQAGLVHSQRGLRGGFALARPPEQITAWEVLSAVDPLPRIRQCPLALCAADVRLCRLHERLDQALAMVEQILRETTVAELLEPPQRLEGKRCPFPHVVLPSPKRGA